MARLQGHRTAELRSLAYHRRVAEKLVQDRSLLEHARERIEDSIRGATPGSLAAEYALGWRQLLEGPLAALLEFLASDSHEARDLRQASPFAGALTARERWQLWREAAGQDADGSA